MKASKLIRDSFEVVKIINQPYRKQVAHSFSSLSLDSNGLFNK